MVGLAWRLVATWHSVSIHQINQMNCSNGFAMTTAPSKLLWYYYYYWKIILKQLFGPAHCNVPMHECTLSACGEYACPVVKLKNSGGRQQGAESAKASTLCITWGPQPQWGEIPPYSQQFEHCACPAHAADECICGLEGWQGAMWPLAKLFWTLDYFLTSLSAGSFKLSVAWFHV